MEGKDRKNRDSYYKDTPSGRLEADERKRRIQSRTLAIIISEFVLIAAGILVFGLTQNFILMVVAVGIFILTIVLGANEKELRCAHIKVTIKGSKNKKQGFAKIVDDKIVSATTVNGELTKVIMEFKFKLDDKRYFGYKILNVKKLRGGKDFKDNDAYVKRLEEFNAYLEEKGAGLDVLYVEGKKYCYITDSADSVFNYFISDVLLNENKAKKFR